MSDKSTAPAYLAEFVGTFMLVFTANCVNLSSASAAFGTTAIACTLMVMIYSFGSVSGGHLNPTVSLAAGFAKKMQWPKVGAYIIAQVGAGFAAGFLAKLVFQDTVHLHPKAPFSWWEAMVVEVLYSAMIAFVVLSVTSKRNNPESNPNQFYGLAIGFVVVAGGYAAGPISGGSFNPAVSLGLDIPSFHDGVLHGYHGFVYSAYEVVGALLASVLFRLTRPEEYDPDYRTEEELEGYRPVLATKLASEFIGTFMLVLTVGLNVAGNSLATALSAGSALMCMIYALGDVSGGHFNPAVTLATVFSKKGGCSPRDGVAYMIIQVIAGVFASLLYAGLYDSRTWALGPKLDPVTNLPYRDSAVYFVEMLFTFVIAFVVLSTACVKGITTDLPRNYYFGLAIGFSVVAGGFAVGNVSGGLLNPAISFGIGIANTLNFGRLYYCWTFCVFELIGGVLAALVFQITHAKEYSKARDDFRLASHT